MEKAKGSGHIQKKKMMKERANNSERSITLNNSLRPHNRLQQQSCWSICLLDSPQAESPSSTSPPGASLFCTPTSFSHWWTNGRTREIVDRSWLLWLKAPGFLHRISARAPSPGLTELTAQASILVPARLERSRLAGDSQWIWSTQRQ